MVNLRRLLLSCIVGLVIVAAISVSVWYWNQTSFSAVAQVRVLENPPHIAFATSYS